MTISDGSYAQYEDFDSFSYKCISYLIDNDEVVWKLLKYMSPDAWNQTNLTRDEKIELIYNGSDDSSKFKVFLDSGSPDAFTREDCLIRISPHSLFPENRTVGTINIMFEVYANFHVNTLSNYKTRTDMITKRFIQVFNGINIGGIGRLYFDRVGSYSDRSEYVGGVPMRGRWTIMSNKST